VADDSEDVEADDDLDQVEVEVVPSFLSLFFAFLLTDEAGLPLRNRLFPKNAQSSTILNHFSTLFIAN